MTQHDQWSMEQRLEDRQRLEDMERFAELDTATQKVLDAAIELSRQIEMRLYRSPAEKHLLKAVRDLQTKRLQAQKAASLIATTKKGKVK